MGNHHFRTSTLKPSVDQAMAAEGTTVILWGDFEEAVVMRRAQADWQIIRHPAVGWESDCAKLPTSAAGFCWQGVRYACAGELLRLIDKSQNDESLREIYDELFHEQQARVLNRLGDVNLRGHATA